MGLLHLAHFHEMTKKYQARHLDSWLGSGSKSKVFEGHSASMEKAISNQSI
jgi:hypothetical protein